MSTDTEHLIKQALRELEIEDATVSASLEHPGFYDVTRTTTLASIPMDADYKAIIAVLKPLKVGD